MKTSAVATLMAAWAITSGASAPSEQRGNHLAARDKSIREAIAVWDPPSTDTQRLADIRDKNKFIGHYANGDSDYETELSDGEVEALDKGLGRRADIDAILHLPGVTEILPEEDQCYRKKCEDFETCEKLNKDHGCGFMSCINRKWGGGDDEAEKRCF
ncbi:Uu.00g000560.m01.CDS01 [Anthostomella pinea]|uniref:Uu.00g000560.m01.CDS01 n=1 Tax=Anthostomella pinea TaxID=933095 RepID=A0AAI8YIG2_9PEZI|nr:Uu.00g000560.m01.CDS01 [Anthostomella pinea]